MSKKNPVAKFQRRYNKAKVFKDRKRAEKRKPQYNLEELINEDKEKTVG